MAGKESWGQLARILGRDIVAAVGLVAALAVFQVAGPLPVVGLAAVLFAVFAWARLDLALLAVVLVAPFYLPVEANPFQPKVFFGERSVTLVEFAILGSFAGWALRLVTGRLQPAELRRELAGELNRPALLFLAAAALSLLGTRYFKGALHDLRTIVVEPYLFYLMAVTTWRSRRDVELAGAAFILTGTIVGGIALYHYTFVGIVEATGGVRRVLAVYHSPNQLALFLGRVAPMAMVLAALGRRWRAGYAAAAAVMVAALVLTYSRGAWAAIGVSLLVVLLLEGRKRLAAVLAGLSGVAAAVLGAARLERMVETETAFRRFYVWESALAMIRDHPILGVGLDNFLYYYRDGGYRLPQAWQEPDLSHPHNILLDYWTRMGVLGVAALVWLQLAFWRMGLRLRREVGGQERALVVAALASMVDFVAHGLIDNSYFLVDLAVHFWLVYAIVRAIGKCSRRET